MMYATESEPTSRDLCASITPCDPHLDAVFVTADGEVYRYPVVGWVLVHSVDKDGGVCDSEIHPGIFVNSDELNRVVTPDMWEKSSYDSKLVAVLPTGTDPDAEEVERARWTFHAEKRREYARQLKTYLSKWQRADEANKPALKELGARARQLMGQAQAAIDDCAARVKALQAADTARLREVPAPRQAGAA